MAEPKVEIPEDRQNETAEWKKAYTYAISRGNAPKAAMIHADHMRDVEERKGGTTS